MSDIYINSDELEALINTRLYKYYKDYVEPLEIAHDDLIEKNESLSKRLKKANSDNRRLRDESSEFYGNVTAQDFKRLRDQNQKLYQEKKKLEAFIAQRLK